jgi:hypothetical protein
MPLKLRDYQPDAANESNLEYSAVPGYPVFVKWVADDADDNPVTLSVGFPFIVSPRINATLRVTRDELEAAANAVFKPGDSEVVMFAQYGAATRAVA